MRECFGFTNSPLFLYFTLVNVQTVGVLRSAALVMAVYVMKKEKNVKEKKIAER